MNPLYLIGRVCGDLMILFSLGLIAWAFYLGFRGHSEDFDRMTLCFLCGILQLQVAWKQRFEQS